MKKLAHWQPREESIYSPDFGDLPLYGADTPSLVCEWANAALDIYHAEVVRLRKELALSRKRIAKGAPE